MGIKNINRVISKLFVAVLYIVMIGADSELVPSVPIALTNVYTVNESMTDSELFVDANTFTCGASVVCNSNNSEYLTSSSCYECKCNCDEQCSYFGDCCVDIVKPYARPLQTWTCVQRLTLDSTIMKSATALMIQSCPPGDESVESGDVRRCLEANLIHPEEIIPVTDMSTNTTYRNQFCARCNGLTNVEFWQLDVKCSPKAIDVTKSKDDIWLNVIESGSCTINEHPPKGYKPRTCFLTDVTACNSSVPSIPAIKRLCHTGYGPRVKISDTVYHNVFCAMCNGLDIDHICSAFTHTIMMSEVSSLQVLLNFNPKSSKDKVQTVDKLALEFKCNSTQTYDPIMGNCSKILCAPRWDFSDQTCKPLFSSAYGLGYGLDWIVLTSRELNKTEIMMAQIEFEKRIKKHFEKTFNIASMQGYFRQIIGNSSLTTLVSFDDIIFSGFMPSLQLAISSLTHQDTVEDCLRVLANISYKILINNNDTIRLDVKSVNRCDDNFQDPMKSGKVGNELNFLRHGKRCNNLDLCPTKYLQLFEFLPCPFIEVNLFSVSHHYDARNFIITINNKTVELRPESHLYCDSVIQVCVDYLSEIHRQLQSDVSKGGNQTMAIVSLVCISLSLICIFITFVIFCILPQLRTLPGKNTMALMFHLFCAQIIFQTGVNATDNVQICRAMAILIHYFWLTLFSWMAVCAYHMYSTFSHKSLMRSSGNHVKTLIKYTAFCHGFALIFVLSCVGYHLALSEGRYIGYGESICFLDKPMDIGIFFATPLGMIILFNLVCFLKTIRAIRAVPDMKSASNQSNKNHMDIYFRLSVLLGFTWVFGFIAAGLQNEIFWYIFVVLNGLQGVFISLAYCGTKRTSKMLLGRLSQTSVFSFLSGTQSSSLSDDPEPHQLPRSKSTEGQLGRKKVLNEQSHDKMHTNETVNSTGI